MNCSNTLTIIRQGDAARRQLKSLAHTDNLVRRDFDRLLAKIETGLQEAGRVGVIDGVVRRLKQMANNGSMNERDFDRLMGELEKAFENILGKSTDPQRNREFLVFEGGRP